MILDSNIIIYLVQPEYIRLARHLQTNQNIVRVSLISTIEVLGFSRLTSKDKLTFETYLNSVGILPITNEIITEAISPASAAQTLTWRFDYCGYSAPVQPTHSDQ